MAERIGRFEILSEISRSQSACVYKASDPDSSQTVALKTVKLDTADPASAKLLQTVLQEAETTKPLNSQNIAMLYGAGNIDGQFCAAMEYVQGKSIGTMLARQDGFSTWDLQDIARQSCQALDHAHARQVFHYTLEPGKIMVSWDGTVKILGFGVSSLNASAAQASGTAPESLHYMSPEQVRGEPLDARSNLFSLGAVLYEMVTGRKAFGGEDADQLRQEITVGMPVAPAQIVPKLPAALSEVIMKSLAKMPAQRYQSGQDLVSDLEKCNESTAKAPARKNPVMAATPAAPSHPLEAPPAAAKAAAASWGGASSAGKPASVSSSGTANMSAAWPAESEAEAPPAPAPNAGNGRKSRSFSEITELPPLQEKYVAPPAEPSPMPSLEPEAEPEPVATASEGSVYQGSVYHGAAPSEKPKAQQPAELVKSLMAAISKTPPKMFLYSIAGALVIVIAVVLAIYSHVHSENAEERGEPPTAAESAAPQQTSPPAATAEAQPAPTAPEAAASAPSTAEKPVISITPKYARRKNAKTPPPAPPAIVPGQLTVNSTPEGAQVLVDGHHDATWLTPLNVAGLAPGQHLVSVTKSGYLPESRTIDVTSGSKSMLVIQLSQLGATAFVSSVPPGAQLFIDGRDSGKVTPVQISIDKPGIHTFLVKKQGYLDETSSSNLQAGQTFQFAPVLQALGVTDEIKIGGGRFKKIFGGGDTAGMGAVAVRTQPKGAQVAINKRVVDKASPVEFYLNPGTYILDITLSGYESIHRVINVERGGKLAVDETLQRQ